MRVVWFINQDDDQDHSASWVSRLISVNFPGPNFFKFFKKRHVIISKKLTKGSTMKKDLESSPKLSSEHSIEETKKEQETVHNQSEVAINNDSFDASKQSTNQKYFRCSLFTIEPEKQKEFIEQSDSFKKEVRKRLGGGILSAYMIQTERDKILLVGEYDSVENAVKGKIVADEIFLEMDAKFISSPIRTEEGPVVYEVNY